MVEIGLTALSIVQGDVGLRFLISVFVEVATNDAYAKPLVYITATGDAIIDDMIDLQHTARGRTHFQFIERLG